MNPYRRGMLRAYGFTLDEGARRYYMRKYDIISASISEDEVKEQTNEQFAQLFVDIRERLEVQGYNNN